MYRRDHKSILPRLCTPNTRDERFTRYQAPLRLIPSLEDSRNTVSSPTPFFRSVQWNDQINFVSRSATTRCIVRRISEKKYYDLNVSREKKERNKLQEGTSLFCTSLSPVARPQLYRLFCGGLSKTSENDS